MRDMTRGSLRSGKNTSSWLVVSMPLYTSVRDDSDGKYTSVLFSTRLRTQNARRSNTSWSTSAAARKTCRNCGMVPRAVAPTMSETTGSTRQPSTSRPSSAAIRSISATWPAASLSSAARKAVPTAYWPAGGSAKSTTSRRKPSGTPIRMPAPSPESGSAPEAPRWSRLRRAVNACSTMSWLGTPVRVATKATPQASCSAAGSYRPVAAGTAENGVFGADVIGHLCKHQGDGQGHAASPRNAVRQCCVAGLQRTTRCREVRGSGHRWPAGICRLPHVPRERGCPRAGPEEYCDCGPVEPARGRYEADTS